MNKRTLIVTAAGGSFFGRNFFLKFLVIVFCACAPEDSRKTTDVVPGIRYTVIHQNAAPNVIHIVEADLANPEVEIFSVKAGDNLKTTLPLSQLVIQASKTGTVAAAVNGDFFLPDGTPSGAQAINGSVVKDAPDAWLALAVTNRNSAFIDRFHFTGTLIAQKSLVIDGFNRIRQTEETIAYNSFYGARTHTNDYGTEVILKTGLRGNSLGDTMSAVVLEVDSSRGDHEITDSTIVLSTHGVKAQDLKILHPGQRVRLIFTADPAHGRVRTLIGGFPLLVKDKKNMVGAGEATEFYNKKLARTAVGIADNKLFLVCVDGSQTNYSAGLTLNELADFMIGLGCESALNLDGGGSTTMRIRNETVNRPSDGKERNISNALMARKKQ